MVELGLAMTILLVALMAMSASTLRMHALRRQNRERAVAMNAVRGFAEEIHAAAALARGTEAEIGCPSSPLNGWSCKVLAALGVGGLPGNTFAVREITPQGANPTVGDVIVITDETLTDAQIGFELGMPRDLDGDGAIDNTDVSNSARILPVVVRARWTGQSGNVTIAHPFYIMGY